MVYPQHWLLSYGGTLGGGQEVWSNSIRFAGGDPLLRYDDPTVLTDIAGDIRTMFGSAYAMMLADTKVEWVKFNEIGPDGRYASGTDSNTLFLSGTDVISGTVSSPYMPLQHSLVLTLRTEVSRGHANAGRIYLPRPATTLDEFGRVPATTRDSIVQVYATFLRNIGDWPGINGTTAKPAIVSRIISEPEISGTTSMGGGGTTGVWRHIKAVEIGDVPDTQRRRRNALTENRVKVAL